MHKIRCYFILFLFFAFVNMGLSFSQPADFTGKWILNKSKGDTIPGVSTFALDIIQNGDSMIIYRIFDFSNREPLKRKESYNLNDKEGKKIKSINIETTILAAWSTDKQSFSITTILVLIDGSSKELKRTEIYALLDDGKTLIQTTEDSPREAIIKPNYISRMIFDKN